MGLETILRLVIGGFLYSLFGQYVNYILYYFLVVIKYFLGVFLLVFGIFGVSELGKFILWYGVMAPFFFFAFKVLKSFLFK